MAAESRLLLAKVLYVIFGLAAFFYSSSVFAQSCTSAAPCDQGMAWSMVNARASSYETYVNSRPGSSGWTKGVEPASCGTDKCYYRCYVIRTGTGTAGCTGDGGQQDFYYLKDKTCASRGEETGWLAGPAQVCFQGCVYTAYSDPDVGRYWSTFDEGSGTVPGLCTSNDTVKEPEIDTDGDGVPDDQDAFPNDPNESVDTDGDGIGDNADIAPEDPENGKDDGEGDEKDNQAAGGADCRTPPSCSGDGIQCNMLYQTWRTRCAVESQGGKVTGAPGDCGAGYTCEGTGVACAQLAVARQQLCGTGDGDGDGTVTGSGSCDTTYVCTGGDAAACAVLRETHKLRCTLDKLTEGNGDDDYGEENTPSDFFGVGAEGADTDLLDSNGWLSNRSCPAYSDPVLSRLGGNMQEGLSALCDGASVLAAYVLILGFMHAAWILGRAVSGSNA